MARIADIPKLAAEIKALLIKYDGVPSANVDRKAYAKIYASFKRYANEPEFINLIDEFKLNVIDSHLSIGKGTRRGPGNDDFEQKAKELLEIVRQYNGMPSQSQDSAAYAKINYYLKRYGDRDELQELKKLCNIENVGSAYFKDKLEKIEQVLKEEKRIPAVKENPSQYYACRNLFKKHSDQPDVKRLMYIYVSSSLFPLPNTKFGPMPAHEMEEVLLVHSERIVRMSDNPEYYRWRRDVNYEYICFVYENYGVLPAEKTKPMQFLLREIEHWERYNIDANSTSRNNALLMVLEKLVELGYKEPYIIHALNSLLIKLDELNCAVRQLVINNGSCAIHYIAQGAIPSMPLSDRFVYYYFYNLHNDRPLYREQLPCLGELYASFDNAAILRVHYRDLYKCKIDQLRTMALKYNRNWEDFPPLTQEDWQNYGICMFFMAEKSSKWSHLTFNTETNFIESCFQEGHEYFNFYKSDSYFKYADYVLFLLENGYKLGSKSQTDLVDAFMPDKICRYDYYHQGITEDDTTTLYSILCKRDDCFVDKSGVVYSMINNEKCLLMFPPKATSVRIASGTKRVYFRAILTCKDSLTSVVINSGLESVECSFSSTCDKLEEIIIPNSVIEKYQKIFSKHDVANFKDKQGNVIPPKAIFEGTKLVSVPYGPFYEVPEGTTEIAKSAFSGSGVKKVVIAGSIREIHEALFWYNETVEEIILKEGVEILQGGSIFGGCHNLYKIQLPSSLHKISGSILNNSINVKSLIFPGDIDYLYDAFSDSSLEYLCFKGHVDKIDSNAFGFCGHKFFLKIIEFKGSVNCISNFFHSCPMLEEVVVTGKCNSLHGFEDFNLKRTPVLKKITLSKDNEALFYSKIPSEFHYLLHVQ